MDPDTTTPQEREKGKLLTFGLKTGQALPILTKEPTKEDLDLLVIESTEGVTYTIALDQIVWTSSQQVDIPTEADVEAYKAKLRGVPEINAFNAASAIRELDQLKTQRKAGPYL